MDAATRTVISRQKSQRVEAMRRIRQAADEAIARVGTDWGDDARIVRAGGPFRRRVAAKPIGRVAPRSYLFGVDGKVYYEDNSLYAFIIRLPLTERNIKVQDEEAIVASLNTLS